MLGLMLHAELNGVTDLDFVDDPSSPYIFTFKIQCGSCREMHPNPVTFTQYEAHEIPGSRGEANFVFRCTFCRRQHSASIKLVNLPYNSSGPRKVATIDSRGIMFVEFIPDGVFKCKGKDTTTTFDEVDLTENEWYDYDEKAGEEVSITDVKWDISKN